MNAWQALKAHVVPLAEKLRRVLPPKLRVVVHGEVVYWALLLPPEEDLKAHAQAWGGVRSWEEWLLDRLDRLEADFPEALEVELLGVWAGSPPRVEPVAAARPKGRKEVREYA
ncbi:hypothetical protein [Thermus sp. NMX2.A1]|uniref:hypothetical protein n=1 Tax=Thermus sp. NMX2.A1 TaxID=570924 RepID=UPI000427A15F|nr:hypothetical protein [Thermus sp. NMX2.A1]